MYAHRKGKNAFIKINYNFISSIKNLHKEPTCILQNQYTSFAKSFFLNQPNFLIKHTCKINRHLYQINLILLLKQHIF